MIRRVAFVAGLLCACPSAKAPNPVTVTTASVEALPSAVASVTPSAVASVTPSAVASAAASAARVPLLRGGWAIEVTSASPGVNPALFDTPEKKAKAFYDHSATVDGDQVRLLQRTLGKRVAVDGAQATELEALVLEVDWKELQRRTSLEEGQVGGTIFRFKVTLGSESIELTTGKLKERSELKAITLALKQLAGAP